MFRINLYLKFIYFIIGIVFFKNKKEVDFSINKHLKKISNKKKIVLTSQGRIGLLLVLQYLKKKYPKKNEIIFTSYNLPEIVNIAKNLGFKINFNDINYETGFVSINEIKKKINKKTNAIILTNMFNHYQNSLELKKIANKNKISLIEDNAIYFDNFSIIKSKKKYAGSLGDFSLFSFNVMKNISALYGGAVAFNNLDFFKFYNNEKSKLKKFPILILLNQIKVFLILKIMSIKILYRLFFFKIIKISHNLQINFLLKILYPSLKFKEINFPSYYFTKISDFSKKLIYLQLNDLKSREKNFILRKEKNIYYYNQFLKLKKNNYINLIKIVNFNYQNFIDFPILVKEREKLNKFLLKKGIEIRFIYYKNCEKIFSKKTNSCTNSRKYENEIVCLPNHKQITKNYIDKIIKNIKIFYELN